MDDIDYSIGIASELFNLDLDDIQLTPSLLDSDDDSNKEMEDKFGL